MTDTETSAGRAHESDRAGIQPQRAAALEAARDVVRKWPPATTPTRTFLGACFDAGLAWVHFPVGLGGRGVPRGLQSEVDTILQAAGGPVPFETNPMAYGMAAPTIVTHGSIQLQQRLLRPMYTCDELWCQLFSEPGAGSDLAGLATSAVLDGDEWVVSGQKVWTSLAHLARWGMLLARTDPGVPKHQGLTFFVLDMTAPGVIVRPLRQMTGESEFNEVFLDRVRVPDTQRVGPIGAGWKVAMTTLSNERNAIGQIGDARGSGLIGVALRLWDRRPELRTPVFEHRLTELLVRSEAARFTSMRRRAIRASVAAGAADKLVWAELGQAIFNFCVDLLGPEAARYEDYGRERAAADLGDGVRRRVGSDPDDDDIMRMALRSRAYTIEGGTSDVLRNVIAERILGLPPDLRNDLGRPWNEVRRG